MKTIKVILIIISTLVVAFLATGLLVQQTNYSATVSIDKPIDEVFSNFMQIDSVKNWIPDIKSVKPVNINPGITGSVYDVVVLNQGQEIITEILRQKQFQQEWIYPLYLLRTLASYWLV